MCIAVTVYSSYLAGIQTEVTPPFSDSNFTSWNKGLE